MAAMLPEIQALDDVVALEEWESDLWHAETVEVKTSSRILPSPSTSELTCLIDAADEYLEACWADEQDEVKIEEQEWAPMVKRRSVSTPVKVKAVQASAWSIDEAVRQEESVDRMRLFARVCNAEARITALEHELAAITSHTEMFRTQHQELKWRSNTCGDVLRRAQKINFVKAIPKLDTNCDF